MIAATAMPCSAQAELVLGGQKSGKSRYAEGLAQRWLAGPGRRALLLATAQARDAEMSQRIERHRRERAARVPALEVLEAPGVALLEAVALYSQPQSLLVIDCLPLWLTQCAWPENDDASALGLQDSTQNGAQGLDLQALQRSSAALVDGLRQARGPLVLVSHEIGLGVIPMGASVRAFVDALGALNQQLAADCGRVTLMVAGCSLALKGAQAKGFGHAR